jgi:hypothetical protein
MRRRHGAIQFRAKTRNHRHRERAVRESCATSSGPQPLSEHSLQPDGAVAARDFEERPVRFRRNVTTTGSSAAIAVMTKELNRF